LLALEIIGRICGLPLLLPWPSYIVTVSLPSLAVFGGASQPDLGIALLSLGSHLAVTIWRIILGVILGCAAGFLIGSGTFLLARRCSGETILLALLRSLPLFGLIPLFILWFAGREIGIWMYIGFSTAIVVATGFYQAIINIPSNYLLQAKLLGATPLKQFYTVVVPAMAPELMGTVRNILGLSWAFSLGAEYTSSGDGLGHLVYLSYLYADMGKLAVLAAVYCIFGLMVHLVWSRISAQLTRWA